MIHLLDMRLELDAACLPCQRVPLVVNVNVSSENSSPNWVGNYGLKWITLNFVPYPVKDVFSCYSWNWPNLLLSFLCVNMVGSSSAVCECAQERNTLALAVSVLVYPECSSSLCKRRCEGNLSDSCERPYSSTGCIHAAYSTKSTV